MKKFIFGTDGELRINAWGRRISDFTGRTFSEVRGMKYYEVIPRIFNSRSDAISQAIRAGISKKYDGYSFRCFNGHILADIEIKPLALNGSGIKGAKVSIAPRALCPVAVNYHNAERLISIGKVASTFAHGIRNHLNVIKGVVEWLNQKYAADAALLDFTAITEDEILQMDNFISKFLSSSISKSHAAEIDVNQLLRRIEVLTGMQTVSKNIELHYSYGDAPRIWADQFQVEQAVLNVINNSLEAMEPGGMLSVRSAGEFFSGGEAAVIEIADTGRGISHTKLKRFAAAPSLNRYGRGFGLFLTREILHGYGGEMEVKSRQGKGTNVRLVFPAQKSSE